MSSSPNCRGFTMLEFVLVVVISSILILGLSAVVDVPMQMAEREVNGGSAVSSADRLLAILDEDVRFAKGVASPEPKTLDVTDQAGNLITYVWDGVPGGSLTRTAPGGSAVVLKDIEALVFTIGLSDLKLAPDDSPTAETPIQTAAFDKYALKSGYTLSNGAAGGQVQGTVQMVSESVSGYAISGTSFGAILFTATGLGADVALPVSVRVRVRRSGTADLVVQIFETAFGGQFPNPFREVAVGQLSNTTIPVSFSDVVIPLTPGLNMVDGGRYFMLLRASDMQGSAAELEVRTLSDPDAVVLSNQGFLYSNNGGGSFGSMSTKLDASQAVFKLEVQSTTVLGGGGSTTIQVPTSVHLDLKLRSFEGVRNLQTNFLVENSLVRVKQGK